MAEAPEKKSGAQTAMEATGRIKQAAKLAADVGRVFAGDMSAIKDVLANKLLWEIILVVAIIISMVGMLIGAAITGVLQFLATSWSENWEENMLDQAIQSNGDKTMYKTFGWVLALDATVKDVISDAFAAITKAGIQAGIGSSDNGQIENPDIQSAGRNPTEQDYETTMQAIANSEKLQEALVIRLEMIQGRVKQRGLQIKSAAIAQYIENRNSDYNSIAKELSKQMADKMATNKDDVVVLYAGFNEALSEENFNFDMTAFDLTDLQALKLLAIFSIQHDCQLTEMDMWTLMDYCGWYTNRVTGELGDRPDSIYETAIQEQRYGNDIGSVTEENQGIPIATYEFEPLQVPIWTGTCAPQWYYEELAAIREHNRQYLAYVDADNIPEGMIPWGIDTPTADSNTFTIPGSAIPAGHIKKNGNRTYKYFYIVLVHDDWHNEKSIPEPQAGKDLTITDLMPGRKYTIYINCYRQRLYDDGSTGDKYLDKQNKYAVFTTPAKITAEEADTGIDVSQFEKLAGYETFGIIDKLYYSAENHLTVKRNDYSSTDSYSKADISALGDKDIYDFWEKYIWAKEKSAGGGTVKRNDAGVHSYTYGGTIPSGGTNYTYDENGYVTKKVVTSYGYGLYKKNDGFWGGWTYVSGGRRTYSNLDAETRYRFIITRYTETTKYKYTYDDEGNITGTTPQTPRNTSTNTVDRTFTTFEDRLETMAYQLYVEIDLSFAARTVDEIAFDLLGIWPGNLEKVTQVVRTTLQNNLIGKTEDDNYSYCFKGANISLGELLSTLDVPEENKFWIDMIGEQIIYLPTTRATSSRSEDLPLTTTTLIPEYGIHPSQLQNAEQTPDSGWQRVDAHGEPIVFDNISGDQRYFVYMRITEIVEVLDKNGQYSRTQKRYMWLVDEIRPGNSYYGYVADTPVNDGAYYADGHLGNENMLQNWTDMYTAKNGTAHTLEFARKDGYQYESYVDMVMALCELLEIDYSKWDPAVQRAKEFGWSTD